MKVLIFGATGSAGGSVLRHCLSRPDVAEVRTVTRRPLAVEHDKLRAFVHRDFVDYGPAAEAFRGVDACLWCLGVSSTKVAPEEYRTITHDYPLAAAHALRAGSPGAAFHFVSGQMTDEGSRMEWARVKGRTERELMERVGATCWRPAAIGGDPPADEAAAFRLLRPLIRLLKPFPGLYVEGEDIGRAMLQATREGIRGRTIENREIRRIAARG